MANKNENKTTNSGHHHILACEICLYHFNNDTRMPKCLPRCGHTLCLVCARRIYRNGVIRCPFCRVSCDSSEDISAVIPDNWAVRNLVEINHLDSGNFKTVGGFSRTSTSATGARSSATITMTSSSDQQRVTDDVESVLHSNSNSNIKLSDRDFKVPHMDVPERMSEEHREQANLHEPGVNTRFEMDQSQATERESLIPCTIIIQPICKKTDKRTILVRTDVLRPHDLPIMEESLRVSGTDPESKSIEVNVLEIEETKFEFTYTLTKRGIYKFNLTLYGKQVVGCPLEVEETSTHKFLFKRSGKKTDSKKKCKRSQLFLSANKLEETRARNSFSYQSRSRGLFNESVVHGGIVDYSYYY
ncbi:uncharacterized protein [Antedon mediterranea]|uniref:uncharacterized protein n=1 Tax=Antedon mediterranea TaxID=105859 RepID=UPI003AF6907C